jgi:imidazolonepropionase-like amidohydrolase
MWDCHTHPGLLIDSLPNAMLMAFESEAERTLRSARNCIDALAIGFTGLRAVGEANYIDIALRDAFDRGTLTGPRMYVSGPSLKVTGGHGAHGRQGTVYVSMHQEVDGPDAFRAAARNNLKMGTDWIKILVTGGIGGRRERMDEPQMTPDEIRAVTEAAHAKGVKVCAHSGSALATRSAVEAGVDCIEHGYELDREAVALMARSGAYLVPTLIVTQDQDMMEKYEWSKLATSKALAGAQRHRESFQMALEAGVQIAMGADWSPIADSAPREREWMVRCGMTPHQVLTACTRTAASLCGVDGTLGTIEKGKLADLVVVEANPLDDISNLRRVMMVLKGGEIVAQRGRSHSKHTDTQTRHAVT